MWDIRYQLLCIMLVSLLCIAPLASLAAHFYGLWAERPAWLWPLMVHSAGMVVVAVGMLGVTLTALVCWTAATERLIWHLYDVERAWAAMYATTTAAAHGDRHAYTSNVRDLILATMAMAMATALVEGAYLALQHRAYAYLTRKRATLTKQYHRGPHGATIGTIRPLVRERRSTAECTADCGNTGAALNQSCV